MGIGVVALQTTQKKEPTPQPGPPFTSDSAENGLSVDGVTGRIVLGNDVGAAGSPAILLSDREIVTEDALFNQFAVLFNAIITGITTLINGALIQMQGAANTSPSIILNTSGNAGNPLIQLNTTGTGDPKVQLITSGNGSPELLLQTAAGLARIRLRKSTATAHSFEINIDSGGNGYFTVDALVRTFEVNSATFQTQIGPGMVTFNGADLQVSGSLTNRRAFLSKGASPYDIDRDLDSGVLFVNSAAVTFNLPNMAAALNRTGFIFRLCVKDVAGVTVQTFAGQLIRFGSIATSVGGTLASVDVGAYVVLVWDSVDWVTESFVGAWTLT